MILRHHRADSASHTMRFVRGKLVSEGRGIDFHYLPRSTSVISVPIKSFDIRAKVTARSKDMQPVSAEVEVIFRIAYPRIAASTFDFELDPHTGKHRSGAMNSLRNRIRSIMADLIRDEIRTMSVEDVLVSGPNLSRAVRVRMRHEREIRAMGVHIGRVLATGLETSQEATKAIESAHLERSIISANIPTSQGMMMATRPWKETKDTDDEDGQDINEMDCTDNCPFSHMCSDYKCNISDGRARCTLFREFST
ncbi:MAG: hypothetical protein E4H25_03305 [Methanomassiliicoccus sp.]|nr:MAG: hypothetical protein E4H25_03305 [Methanomassiliicoccus sp.]